MNRLEQFKTIAKSLSTIPGVAVGIGLAEMVVPILRESLALPENSLVIIYVVCVIAPTAYLVWQIPNKKMVQMALPVESYIEDMKVKVEEENKPIN